DGWVFERRDFRSEREPQLQGINRDCELVAADARFERSYEALRRQLDALILRDDLDRSGQQGAGARGGGFDRGLTDARLNRTDGKLDLGRAIGALQGG